TRDLHRAETTLFGAIDDAALQIFFRRERNRMKAKVKFSPFPLYLLKNILKLTFALKIERRENRGVDLFSQRFDVRLGRIVEIRDGHTCAKDMKRLGAAPSDALIVSYAGDERDLALKNVQRGDVDHARFSIHAVGACSLIMRS